MEGHRGADPGEEPRAVFAAMEESAEAGAEEGTLDRGGGQSAAIVQAEVRQLGRGGGQNRGTHREAVSRAMVQSRGPLHSKEVSLSGAFHRSNWTAKEDNLILSLQQQWGNRWSSIADVSFSLSSDVATPRPLGKRREDPMEVSATSRHRPFPVARPGRFAALPALRRAGPRGLRRLRELDELDEHREQRGIGGIGGLDGGWRLCGQFGGDGSGGDGGAHADSVHVAWRVRVDAVLSAAGGDDDVPRGCADRRNGVFGARAGDETDGKLECRRGASELSDRPIF